MISIDDESHSMPKSSGTSLINFGDLAKPAVALIEKISDAVGGIAKPWQIERVARAEAAANLIKTKARIKISELEERALRRMLSEEVRKQVNIENITQKAIPHLSADARADEISNDWVSNFFDKAKLISDEQVQEIWARILANEAKYPGSFSKKTIEILASLDRSDAVLFSILRRMTWVVDEPIPLIFDANHPCEFDKTLNFTLLHHLDDLGLINVNQGTGYYMKIDDDEGKFEGMKISYFTQDIFLQITKGAPVDCGVVMLTNSGKQIIQFCDVEPCHEYFYQILKRWIDLGYMPYSKLMN